MTKYGFEVGDKVVNIWNNIAVKIMEIKMIDDCVIYFCQYSDGKEVNLTYDEISDF